jgi:hypothetical protein
VRPENGDPPVPVVVPDELEVPPAEVLPEEVPPEEVSPPAEVPEDDPADEAPELEPAAVDERCPVLEATPLPSFPPVSTLSPETISRQHPPSQGNSMSSIRHRLADMNGERVLVDLEGRKPSRKLRTPSPSPGQLIPEPIDTA